MSDNKADRVSRGSSSGMLLVVRYVASIDNEYDDVLGPLLISKNLSRAFTYSKEYSCWGQPPGSGKL